MGTRPLSGESRGAPPQKAPRPRTFPSGWAACGSPAILHRPAAAHYGPVISNPAVNPLGSPVGAVRKSKRSDAAVDFPGHAALPPKLYGHNSEPGAPRHGAFHATKARP